jgi:hypothetical protein
MPAQDNALGGGSNIKMAHPAPLVCDGDLARQHRSAKRRAQTTRSYGTHAQKILNYTNSIEISDIGLAVRKRASHNAPESLLLEPPLPF